MAVGYERLVNVNSCVIVQLIQGFGFHRLWILLWVGNVHAITAETALSSTKISKCKVKTTVFSKSFFFFFFPKISWRLLATSLYLKYYLIMCVLTWDPGLYNCVSNFFWFGFNVSKSNCLGLVFVWKLCFKVCFMQIGLIKLCPPCLDTLSHINKVMT